MTTRESVAGRSCLLALSSLAALCFTLMMTASVRAAIPVAEMTITTPNPTLSPGKVLVPVSAAGAPCFTEVEEGEIANIDDDWASAKEKRIMKGEITGIPADVINPPVRWTVKASCSAEVSVTVVGPGNAANPPVGDSTYRAYASQLISAETRNWNDGANPVLLKSDIKFPEVTIRYPLTGTLTHPAAANEVDFDEDHDHLTKVQLTIRSWAEVSLKSERLEVTLKGYAKQAVAEWSGSMTAWAIGGDDVFPVKLLQADGEPAEWDVR